MNLREINKKFPSKLYLALIFSMGSSLLITSYILPVKALEILQSSREFLIAKTPDEREPEAVQQGIEQIPVSQPSTPPQKNQAIESPIPPAPAPSPTPASTPTTQPTGTGSTPAPSPKPEPRYRPSAPSTSQPKPQPRYRRSNSPQPRTSQPTNNQNSGGAAVSPSSIPNSRQINFVDLPIGVLSPSDFKSQGRYFHFYQFEGRENQLVQIRLAGSGDQRRSSNLNLDPFMILLDPNNNVLAKRSSAGTGSGGVRDAFLFVRLPVKGVYTIAVTSRNPGEIGRYSLALRNDRASYTLDESSQLTATGSVLKKNGSPYNISKFKGKKDQLVSIRVDSVLEQFPPYIVLLDSKGQIIAADNDKDGRYTALIDRARLPEDGIYYVVVISAVPQQNGTYRLTIF